MKNKIDRLVKKMSERLDIKYEKDLDYIKLCLMEMYAEGLLKGGYRGRK